MNRILLPQESMCDDFVLQVQQHLRLQVVLETLGVSPVPDSLHIPKGLQLAVYVTCFWLKHAKPEPRAEMFWALLSGLVYGHLCRELRPKKGKKRSVKEMTESTA